MSKRYVVVRSFAGTQYGSYGQGDEFDELPEGVDWVKAGLVVDREAESAMLASPPPKRTGRGLKPVTDVAGVGPKLAEALAEIDIATIVDLTVATPEMLEQVPGISERSAKAIIKAAREALK